MHSEILSRSLVALLVPAAAFALSACGGAGSASGTDHASASDVQVEAHPGHGNASIVGQDLTAGDRVNAYDTTDDPSDPAFVPTKSALKHYSAAGPVASTSSAMSTTSGTSFQLTYYDVSRRPAGDPDEVTIRDCSGNFLTKASYAWRDDVVMQGTGRFVGSDGSTKTINDGGGCFVSLPYSQRWGLGVENPATGNEFELRVFRSIAVDRSVLTIGKWYYIQELDGAVMPSPSNGLVHDGCVRAMDVGPAITGRHIDFFVGYFTAYTSLINGSTSMGGLESVTMFDGAAKCQTHISRGY